MRLGLSFLAVLPLLLPLATARPSSSTSDSANDSSGTMNPSVKDSESGSEGSSVSDGSSIEASGSSSSEEESNKLLDIKKNIRSLKSKVEKRKKAVKRSAEGVKFSNIPDHIDALKSKLAKYLKKLKIYDRLKMDKVLAMSPEALRKDITEKRKSSKCVPEVKLFKKKLDSYTGKKETLKSQIEEKRAKYKKRTKKSSEDQESHEEAINDLKKKLDAVRKKINSYEKELQVCSDMKKLYKLLLDLPLEEIVGKESLSALYESYTDALEALEREERKYARLTGKAQEKSSSSEEEEQTSSSSQETGSATSSEEKEVPRGHAHHGSEEADNCGICQDPVNEAHPIMCLGAPVGPNDPGNIDNPNGTGRHPCCINCFCNFYDSTFMYTGGAYDLVPFACPACRANFSNAEVTRSQIVKVGLIRKMRDNKKLQDRYMVNGKPVKEKSREAKTLLGAARKRVKRYLKALKEYPDYDMYFDNMVAYPDFCIPENVVKYLLKDHDQKSIGYQNHKAAFINRAKKSLRNPNISSEIRDTTLPRLLEALWMEDVVLEYLYTSKLFDMNNNRANQRHEIATHMDVYPAIYSMLRIGDEYHENRDVNGFSLGYAAIKNRLESANDNPGNMLNTFDYTNTWMMNQI